MKANKIKKKHFSIEGHIGFEEQVIGYDIYDVKDVFNIS